LRNDEPDPIEDVVVKDKIVQQTDQDASVSRMSAVDVGYLNDAFAQHFAGERTRRFPIINRGQKPSSSPVSWDRLQERQAPMFAPPPSTP